MRTLVAIAMLLAGATALHAAEAPPVLVYPCERVATAPVVDGRLDDAAWEKAALVSGFTYHDRRELAPVQTAFRVVYDAEALYVGVRCEEPLWQKMTPGTPGMRDTHAAVFGGEAIEVFIDPKHNHSDYFQIAANSDGTLFDGKGTDSAWDGRARAAGRISEGGWSLEIALPWADFEVRPEPGLVIGLNICRDRNIGPNKLWSTWSPIAANFHDPLRFGHLVLSAPPEMIGRLSDEFRKGGHAGPVQVFAAEGFSGTTYLALASRSLQSLDATLAMLRVAVNTALEVLHAPDVGRFRPEGIAPLFIFGLYDVAVASEVKLSLMDVYPDDYPVTVVRGAGVEGRDEQETIPLYRLDRVSVDHLTSLFVPAMERRPATSFERLVEVMAALRKPDGCPWDREQTHETLKKYLTEETYEFFDAIDDQDDERMADELGDLLLQMVFHARIAEEEGRFDIHDAIRSIVEKLIRRHPHVFGGTEVSGADEVLDNWEKIKAGERLTAHRKSLLDAVPRAMPSLQRAFELTRRASKVGFDWKEATDVLDKVGEEAEEAREALAAGDQAAVRHEIGDLLFAVANLARKAGVDPDDALHAANRRFSDRFRYIEARAQEQDTPLAEMSLEEMDRLWNEAKTRLDHA